VRFDALGRRSRQGDGQEWHFEKPGQPPALVSIRRITQAVGFRPIALPGSIPLPGLPTLDSSSARPAWPAGARLVPCYRQARSIPLRRVRRRPRGSDAGLARGRRAWAEGDARDSLISHRKSAEIHENPCPYIGQIVV
jgi:hypothetical protein